MFLLYVCVDEVPRANCDRGRTLGRRGYGFGGSGSPSEEEIETSVWGLRRVYGVGSGGNFK